MPCFIVLQDFANIFKAFIGTNYLTISFALKESGLLLGLTGIAFILFATAHCCYLIVKCKKEVVKRIVTNRNSLKGYVSSRLLTISESELERTITYGDVARAVLGRLGSILTNVGLFVTQFGFCVGYFIFIADTLETTIDSFSNSTNSSINSSVVGEHHVATEKILKVHSHETWWQYFTMNIMHKPNSEHHVIQYQLLLLIPLPFFLLFAMMKRIRDMGIISSLANLAVLIGFISISVVILKDFEISKDVTWYANYKSFPIFFGQVTSAYEGIGTIIPIETSMEGNRSLYPLLLHLALFLFTAIYCFMGILGYLKYGNHVQQVLIWSLPPSTWVALFTNATICIGVLLTYPLQNFVAVEIVETAIWGSSIYESNESTEVTIQETREPLLNSGVPQENGFHDDDDDEVSTRQPARKVPFWKRVIVRALLVIIQLSLALFLKQSYAYFSALVGAIGSTLLAFILPCLIHLRLKGGLLPPMIVVKDVLFIVFGVVGMLTGVYCSILNIISKLHTNSKGDFTV